MEHALFEPRLEADALGRKAARNGGQNQTPLGLPDPAEPLEGER
jgi:hypothetical protein